MAEGLCASSARPPGRCSLLGERLAEKKQTDSDCDRRKRSKPLEGADIWELVETIIRSIRQSSTCSRSAIGSVLVRRKGVLNSVIKKVNMRDFVLAAADEMPAHALLWFKREQHLSRRRSIPLTPLAIP